MIDPKKLAGIKSKMRKVFVRSLVSESLSVVINKGNTLIRGICNYYSISRECRMQLDSFEPYFVFCNQIYDLRLKSEVNLLKNERFFTSS